MAYVNGAWLALLSWSTAADLVAPRDAWIGWSNEERRRPRLLANHSRFLILRGVACPNLATRVLALNLARLSADWERAYAHPTPAAESFVDGRWFRGTCDQAQGWSLLGPIRGHGRHAEDHDVAPARPKQLWVRALAPEAGTTVRAAVMPTDLQAVEVQVPPQPEVKTAALHSPVDHGRAVPEWRGTKGRDYPRPGLPAMIAPAFFGGAARGQRDPAAFANGLTQGIRTEIRRQRCAGIGVPMPRKF